MRALNQAEGDARRAEREQANKLLDKTVKEALLAARQKWEAEQKDKDRKLKESEGNKNRGVRASEGSKNRGLREKLFDKKHGGSSGEKKKPVAPPPQ